MTVRSEEKWLDYRVRTLPAQLDRARLRVQYLETEAERLGMRYLLGTPAQPASDHTDIAAWMRQITHPDNPAHDTIQTIANWVEAQMYKAPKDTPQ